MTLRKKAVYFLLSFVLVWLCIEAMAMFGHLIVNGSLFPKAAIKRDINSNFEGYNALEQVDQAAIKWGDVIEVIHPYFGFVLDPHRNQRAISDFGFDFGKDNDPITKKMKDMVIVGIFGGSFAHGTFMSAKTLLQQCPAFSGKQVEVRNFASGGYKQPQQLLILAYLLSLGAEFDVIINIDGFNEVVLPYAENIPNNVYPFYPRMWHLRTSTVLDPVIVKQIGEIRFLEGKKRSWAQSFHDYALYRSPLLALLWQFRDRQFARQIYEIGEEIKTKDNQIAGYVASGPAYSYSGDQVLFKDLVQTWKYSSIQIKALAEANNAKYYHFLQPNQYVDGSKPMSEEEKKIAVVDHPHREGVEKGYPILRKAGTELAGARVNYTDLTMIFSANPEPLYVDSCCHVNRQGYDIVVDHLCDRISNDPLSGMNISR